MGGSKALAGSGACSPSGAGGESSGSKGGGRGTTENGVTRSREALGRPWAEIRSQGAREAVGEKAGRQGAGGGGGPHCRCRTVREVARTWTRSPGPCGPREHAAPGPPSPRTVCSPRGPRRPQLRGARCLLGHHFLRRLQKRLRETPPLPAPVCAGETGQCGPRGRAQPRNFQNTRELA